MIADAGGRPTVVREPVACRAEHVDGPGTFARVARTIHVTPRRAPAATTYRLPGPASPSVWRLEPRSNCEIYASRNTVHLGSPIARSGPAHVPSPSGRGPG